MIAFVMSGGANRGALEAGALLALFEAGIQPDILVGTSAGSINAAYIATDPTLAGAQRLADISGKTRREDFFPGSSLAMLWRLVRGRSLFSSDNLRRSLQAQLPPDKRRFGDLRGVRLYITAANLTTSTLYLYGNQPNASLIDAVMASTAHPLAYPPARLNDWQLVDGGVLANVPVGIAVDNGATKVYILNVGYNGAPVAHGSNIFQVLAQSISTMMYQHFVMDLKQILENTDVVLHHILLQGFEELPMWDLDHGAEMVELGHKTAQAYLREPLGLAALPESLLNAAPDQPVPDGAEIYVPTYFSPCDVLDLPPSERLIATYLARHGATHPATLVQDLGRTAGQVRLNLASLTRKGYVQCLPDGKAKLIFGQSHRRKVSDDLWNALDLPDKDTAGNCFDKPDAP